MVRRSSLPREPVEAFLCLPARSGPYPASHPSHPRRKWSVIPDPPSPYSSHDLVDAHLLKPTTKPTTIAREIAVNGGEGEAHTESALVEFIIWNQITHFFQFYPLHVFRFPSSLNPGTHHLLPGLRQFVPSRPVSPPRIHTDRKSDRLTLGSDFPVALATSNMLDCVTFQ